jgi:hypothetical protein
MLPQQRLAQGSDNSSTFLSAVYMTSAVLLSNEPTGGSSVADPKLGCHNRLGWAGLHVEGPALWFLEI